MPLPAYTAYAPRWVVEATTSGELRTYIVLRHQANTGGDTRKATIAELVGASLSAVDTHLTSLRRIGAITTVRTATVGAVAEHTFHDADPAER